MAITKKSAEKSKKDDLEKISLPKEIVEPLVEKERVEAKENISEEKLRALKNKIEKTDLDDVSAAQAQTQAQSVKSLQEEGKIKKLLAIAKSKGVVYAVAVAKKMNDPYVLDMLHDTLVKEGLYKQFLK